MYKLFIRPLLFLFSPESAHHLVVSLLKTASIAPGFLWYMRMLYSVRDKRLERQLFGLTFKNPVGLAAGFDKDARFIDEFAALGFGFIEIGTITPKGQPGNPKPRLFRLAKDRALINRMGFNNRGAKAAATQLKKRRSNILIGGNIGKNKITPNEEALHDYAVCFETLFDHVDYFVVNVSSPNTPGLRALQEKGPLKKLLLHLKVLNSKKNEPKPILLKIAPDLTNNELDDIIDIVQTTGIDGLIATNTTINRDGLATKKETLEEIGTGGLSGRPLRQRFTEVIRYIRSHSTGYFPIIGVGGIHSAKDALEKIEAGADLVQLYTGFIYEGARQKNQ